MKPSLESRKLNLIKWIIELEDEAILQQIENLLKVEIDFWNELIESEKSTIHQGIKDLNEGKRIAYNKFISEIK